MSAFFLNRQIAFLTQHGKQTPVRRILEPALGCVIRHETGFNTDLLGTFSREIERVGSQLDAARRKAQLAMELSGLSLGLGSEGTFASDPYTGMFSWDYEVLLLMDRTTGIEIVGRAQGGAHHAHLLAANWPELEAFARREGFPEHGLVLRPESEKDERIEKDFTSWAALQERFLHLQGVSGNGKVFAEADLRAHANPTRMAIIELAARDLVKRATSLCPACDLPGYAAVEAVRGLPCRDCGTPTDLLTGEVWQCTPCGYRTTVRREMSGLADARFCSVCNP